MQRYLLSLAGIALMLATAAHAQTFPTRTIRLVVPYAAGGLPDVVVRIVSQKMSETLGQPVIVENKPGAGGLGATDAVAASTPDGYTLLVTDGSQITINPHLYSKLSYDPMTALSPVSLIGAAPLFLTVNTSSGIRSMQELIALAKAKPGTLNYGSPGIASVPHLSVEAFKSAANIDVQHVPYKGGSFVVPAMLTSEITFSMLAMSTAGPQMAAGKFRLLAVSAPERSALAPDVPTFAEAGIPDFNFQPRIGIVAPAGTPPQVIATLSREISKATRNLDVVQKLGALGIDAIGSNAEQYAALIHDDYQRYGRIVKTVGVKLD